MLRKSFRTSSASISDVMKKAEVERLKGKVVSAAVNKVINIMNSITGSLDCKVIKSNTSKLAGDRLFDGRIILSTTITDSGTSKTLDIPVSVSNSTIKVPPKTIIARKLSQIPNVNSIKERSERLAVEAMKAIIAREKKASYGNVSIKRDIKDGASDEEIIQNIMTRYPDIAIEQATQILNGVKNNTPTDWGHKTKGTKKTAGLSTAVEDWIKETAENYVDYLMENNPEKVNRESIDRHSLNAIGDGGFPGSMDEGVDAQDILTEEVIKQLKAKGINVTASTKKTAKEVVLPAGGFSYVPSAEVANTIRYPKANLPLSLEKGDTLVVAGRQYKVEEIVNSFQGEQPATEWNLVLQNK